MTMAMECLKGRVERARRSAAWEAYRWARSHVLPLIEEAAAAGADPSRYWQEELAGFDYLLDATPLIVEKLREHCYHITGLLSYAYRNHHQHRAQPLVHRLRQLQALDDAGLFVPEADILGGFGFRIDGQLVNLDTLKFYETLIGMHRAGALASFQNREGPRPLVVEIGGGWGGFAYQFKTRFPHCCYLIVDLPQTLLLSATYLRTLFPDARMAICGEPDFANACANPQQWDFLFAPHYACWKLNLPAPALAINMVSFQEMTTAQVRDYVDWLAGIGCKRIYSHNRERSPHNSEMTSVSTLLAELYEVRRIHVLDTSYTTTKLGKGEQPGAKAPTRWRRLARAVKGGIRRMFRCRPRAATGSVIAMAPRNGKQELDYLHLYGVLRTDAALPRREAEAAETTSAAPRIVLGMPLFNQTHRLQAALDSILAQTYRDFTLVICDDSTEDRPGQIVAEYARRDPRIHYRKNSTRLYMIDNWRACFHEAERLGVDLFAWMGDHDRWHPEWLARLVECHADPTVAVAHPAVELFTDDAAACRPAKTELDTGSAGRVSRIWKVCRTPSGYGNAIYGLFKADVIRRCGVFRKVMMADRMLLTEAALHGSIRHVPAALWYRYRGGERPSRSRQRRTLFRRCPWYAYLPWSVTAMSVLIWNYVLRRSAAGPLSRGTGLLFALMLGVMALWNGARGKTFWLRRVLRVRTRLRRAWSWLRRTIRLRTRLQKLRNAMRLRTRIRSLLGWSCPTPPAPPAAAQPLPVGEQTAAR